MKEKLIKELKSIGFDTNNIEYYDSIDSTNDRAKEKGKMPGEAFELIVADTQCCGKGRLGRSFSSPKGSGIYMTFLLRPEISPRKASMITIVAALAARRGMEETCGIKTLIKWPNDLIADGKKVCGILTEMNAEPARIRCVAVGIGINVNNEVMDEEIADVAVSLNMLSGRKYDREIIIASVVKWFDYYFKEMLRVGNLAYLKDEYNNYLVHRDKEIMVLGKENYKAKSLGITESGELLVEKEGEVTTVLSGEVSIRGVYGYV